MIDPIYIQKVDMLLKIMPSLAKEKIFALKGGTAINLFELNAPRLSVDIDLTYLPVDSRKEAFENIEKGLNRIKDDIKKEIPGLNVTASDLGGEGYVKLNCQYKKVQIKVEVNTITRGHVFPTRYMQLTDHVKDMFDKFAAMDVVSHEELWGGKINAALDRQHPRDLFDAKILLEKEGLTPGVWQGFMSLLIGNNRPTLELLNPELNDQKSAYENQFVGMADIDYSYSELEKARVSLIKNVQGSLTDKDKQFLISYENGQPDWSLFYFPQMKEFPAVKWKQINIHKLISQNPEKHQSLMKSLNSFFDGLD